MRGGRGGPGGAHASLLPDVDAHRYEGAADEGRREEGRERAMVGSGRRENDVRQGEGGAVYGHTGPIASVGRRET